MDLAKYAVTAVLVEKRSVRDVAAATGRSKSWVHRHVQLYSEGGEATPELDGQPLLAKTRVRSDHVDHCGSVTLRYRRKLHHISVGRAHRHKRVIILMADLDLRVVDEDGVLLRHFELDPTRDYQARGRSSL